MLIYGFAAMRLKEDPTEETETNEEPVWSWHEKGRAETKSAGGTNLLNALLD